MPAVGPAVQRNLTAQARLRENGGRTGGSVDEVFGSVMTLATDVSGVRAAEACRT